ncbi:MAG: lysophospholipid acyltransferase family protein [Bacteroidota bacterium]
MIEAKHNYVYYLFFKFYTHFKIKLNFEKVCLQGYFIDRNKPILILANHQSWWDGFWLNYFNEKITQRKLYFMMLEEQLLKYRFFNKIGGFSIRKNSKDAVCSLNYTVKLLENPQNAVFLFPQGEIQSIYTDYIYFEKGISKIINKSGNIQVLFVCNFIEYFSCQKPSLFMYFKEWEAQNIQSIEADYNDYFQSCKLSSRQ